MRPQARGFSLIEALLALLLVTLGLTGTARLQVGLLAASANAKASDEAAAFALDQLAEFQNSVTYAAYRDGIVAGDALRQGLLHQYRLDWQVEHHLDPDYKRVAIQVRWPADEPAQSIRIETLIPGLEVGRFAGQQLQF
ncbi:MAG: prepilin-type N-terminal cleavage/methylation domain-containing protein [Thiohalobacteraceae bacterium]